MKEACHIHAGQREKDMAGRDLRIWGISSGGGNGSSIGEESAKETLAQKHLKTIRYKRLIKQLG
jgi:hypothetical protein